MNEYVCVFDLFFQLLTHELNKKVTTKWMLKFVTHHLVSE